MRQHPHLSHLFYGLKFVLEHENARNELFRVYTDSLKNRWHQYEQLLRQKYDAYLFSGPYQQPAMAMQDPQFNHSLAPPQPQFQDNSLIEINSGQMPTQLNDSCLPMMNMNSHSYQTPEMQQPQLINQDIPLQPEVPLYNGIAYPPPPPPAQEFAPLTQSMSILQPEILQQNPMLGGYNGMSQEVSLGNYNGSQNMSMNEIGTDMNMMNAPATMPQAPPSGFSEAPVVSQEKQEEEKEEVKVIVISPSHSEHSETRVAANVFAVLKQLNSNITKLAEGRVYGN